MNLDNYRLREIQKSDDPKIEYVIRQCLIEFGANHEGTAWADPDLCRFSQIYNREGYKYWVVEADNGDIVGGVGIGGFEAAPDVCELQKMYCLPRARGTGVAHALLEVALDYAKSFYTTVYLETLENMTAAQRFYEKHGFVRTSSRMVDTGHFACDVCYVLKL